MPEAAGYIPVPQNLPIQDKFMPVIADVCRYLKNEAADLVHSAYVYGSISTGLAIPMVSDLDLTLLLYAQATEADQKRLEHIRQMIENCHSVVSKVDFDIGTVDQITAPLPDLAWRFWLKYHCRCIYGEDLNLGIPPFKPSRLIALSVNGDFRQVFERYGEKITACTSATLSQRLRREAARKAIRSTNILRHETDMDWPLTLDDYAERFQSLFPEKTAEMQFFLKVARTPAPQVDDFARRLLIFVDWMDATHKELSS